MYVVGRGQVIRETSRSFLVIFYVHSLTSIAAKFKTHVVLNKNMLCMLHYLHIYYL